MCNIKSSIKYSSDNYLSNKTTFIQIDPVVAEIIASKDLSDSQTPTLKSSEKHGVNNAVEI